MTEEALKNFEDACEETRKKLPSGPWSGEPNRVNWKAHGLDCMAVRHCSSFHWCGYVGVPDAHPDHGKEYDDVDVSVHGGLTYSHRCSGDICHVTEKENEETYWFGFDCAHSSDLSPGIEETLKSLRGDDGLGPWRGVYRTLDYVKAQTEELARQLAERAA